MLTSQYLNDVYNAVKQRNSDEAEFLQAVREVLESLDPLLKAEPKYEKSGVIEALVEPERMISFRVPWYDDKGRLHINRGYRVQFNSAIGPYTGGLRFHPSVSPSIIKFLGFEQTLKNALTTLPMGGAKGGADFDPKGKSDGELMRFCQSFMTELSHHIGQFTDIPTRDMGVGAREIGYLFGSYKRISGGCETGALSGKGLSYGGSLVRTEAGGYGLCYFTQEMLRCVKNEDLKNKTVIISGSGNVAIYACEKAQAFGARVIALSDSDGYIYDPGGIKLNIVKDIKLNGRGRIEEYCEKVKGSDYYEGSKGIWTIKCDVALPCATQNELDGLSAKALIANGVTAVAEGANMPCTPEAIKAFSEAGVLFGPGKAANAGGVTVSGLEVAQNSMRLSWSFKEVDEKLKEIMERIFHNSYSASAKCGRPGDLVLGANVTAFEKLADAMIAQGF